MAALVDSRQVQAGCGGECLVALQPAAAGRCGQGATTATSPAEAR
ncbi:hypothetical protein [Streptomyces sp. SAI-090]|jgi:hypothetical protein|nr:hypothetical protein [Streptomyces sp. SAI-090]MDH6522418.1 hypothetical protein [Streptomyces sp. SAI-090]